MTQHQAPEVTSELVNAVGSIVIMLADARDTFPNHEAALESVTEAVNELYGRMLEGVFGNTRATQPLSLTVDEGLVQRLRLALDFDAQSGTDEQWSRLMAEAHNALDRLQSLSLPVAGEQFAENANCLEDIDRSGLAQDVD